MQTRKLFELFLALGPTSAVVAQEPPAAVLEAWFAKPPTERGALPNAEMPLSRRDAEALVPQLWAACRAGAAQRAEDTLPALQPDELEKALEPTVLQIGAHAMPYVLLCKGEKPPGGWPLFLCLHGGGGNAEAKGPHAWEVNSREWQAQKILFQRVYQPAGLYLIPRMADDRQGRWYFDHNQQAFEELITKCLLFREVDANRVYLMGISEGGYGAIRFAGNRPDRFAATGGMAAAEPLGTSPPENMRNLGLRIDIGERDTLFDRIGLARRMGERLAELRAADPQGYDFVVNVQAGRGHGIDYSQTPPWLAARVRNPRPTRVVWTVQPFHTTVELQRYWLALDERPASMPLYLSATLRENQLHVTVEVEANEPGAGRVAAAGGTLRIRLDDRLADLDAPIEITVNGRERSAVQVVRRLEVMARTLTERLDPSYCFAAEIALDLAGS
ncbi:MAG: hypothetical protein IPN34_06280 [Planctomycetes bacterium]|nr:hypothetical protein [Planctomycetota bacterium]